MSDLTRDDVIDMLQGIFEEQRELTDEEMKTYKDMLRRKEKDMVADKIEIKIEPKLVIPRETADLCARILEAWLLSDDTANIEIINNGCEKEIYLTSMR